METTITANIDYVQGHLRYGHYELILDKTELKEFKQISKEDQISWIEEEGEFILDEYRIEDRGDITDITIEEPIQGNLNKALGWECR